MAARKGAPPGPPRSPLSERGHGRDDDRPRRQADDNTGNGLLFDAGVANDGDVTDGLVPGEMHVGGEPGLGAGQGKAGSSPDAERNAAGAVWRQIAERLRRELGDSLYRSWIERIAVVGVADGAVELAVGTRFERDWVERHYGDRIRSLWAVDGRLPAPPVFVVAQPQSADSKTRAPRSPLPASARPALRPSASYGSAGTGSGSAGPGHSGTGLNGTGSFGAGNSGAGSASSAPRIAALKTDPSYSIAASLQDTECDDDVGAPLDPRLTFENFVVGKPNELAHAAAFRVADTDGTEINPLYLYGGVGLGKTHLMHAIAWHIRRTRPHRKVMYLSAEKFMYRFIRSMKDKDTLSFKELFRSADVLMVDDMQFLGGKDSTQEEFFHTFNALIDQNRQIVLSADKSPSDLERIDERLRSRLGWGLVADIHPTTYELRRGILMSKVERQQFEIPEKVLEFLAHRISSNVRELEGALNRLAAQQRLVGRPITLETAQEVLHDLLRSNDRRLTIEDIKKKVAEYFKVKLSDMSSERRARDVARPRQVAMYLAKQLTQRSLPEIGRQFGGRDHTTVMHAVKRVEEIIGTDPAFAEDVDLLRRMLEG